MERALPAYQIHAVGDDGQVLALATADTATLALAGLMSANQDYTRAWVVDEFNVDVTPEDLMQRAQAERGNT